MRKHLMTSTALAAAAMLVVSGGALAQDKKAMSKPAISVNGYGDFVVGSVIDSDVDTDASAADLHVDSEIHFNGRAALDSGIKFHMRVELETQSNAGKGPGTAGDTIDEAFLSVSGAFGQIILGPTENAASKMITKYAGSWGTGVGQNLSFDGTEWVNDVSGIGGAGSQARLSPGSGDQEKISYISPMFNGFQVGASYIPYLTGPGAEDSNAGSNVTESGYSDGVVAAATYGGKIDAVSVGVGLGMIDVPGNTDANEDLRQWIAAARVGFGPVAVAGAFKRHDTKGAERDILDVGVRYTQGANSFSLVGTTVTPDEGDASYAAAIASYARALGAGVKMHVNVHWNDSDNGMDGAAQKTQSGTALSVGTTVRF